MTLERRRRRRGLSLSSQNSITKKEKRKIDNPKKNKKNFSTLCFSFPVENGIPNARKRKTLPCRIPSPPHSSPLPLPPSLSPCNMYINFQNLFLWLEFKDILGYYFYA
jgi:hypothetical protein